MTEMNESSRRAFLAAIAATGATAAVVVGSDVARAEDGGAGTPGATPSVVRTEAFPAPTPNTYYTYVQGDEFFPLSNSTTWSKSILQVEATTNTIFYASLAALPPGARITEVTFAVVKSAGFPGAASYFLYNATSGSLQTLDFQSNGALPLQTAEQYVNLVVGNGPEWVVDNEQASTHQLVLNLTNSRVHSVRVGWTLARPRAFIPIAPKRVYDSRFIAPLGPLANLANRVVSVANGYINDSATVDVPNVVPVGAKAIAYNITIANTVGSGFLSVNPGNAVSGGGSSINWFTSGLSLANGLVVTLDTSRQIKVFCGGGGSTDFIIDILGYYI